MFHLHYHLLITWLHQHPEWGGIIAFIIAFAESLAIVGSIVPGSVTMTAVGVLIGSGVLPIWTTLIWVVSGAFLGDGVSYLLGFYFTDNVRRVWPFSRYPRVITTGEAFFQRHGGKSVFIGRFVGLVRAIVPVIAGMLKMPPQRYFPVSLITTICWAPIYMLPGILLGAISLTLPADVAAKLIVFILLLLVVFWLVVWSVKWIYKKTHSYFAEIVDDKWHEWLQQPSKAWLCNLLRRADSPYAYGQLFLAGVMLICVALFFLISIDTVVHGPLSHFENSIYYLLRGLRTDTLDKVAIAIMSFGYYKTLGIVVAALTIWLLLKRRWLAASHWVIAWAVVLLSVFWFKILYAILPPPGLLNLPAIPSFPSRYVTGSMVFYIFFAFMITRHANKEIRKYLYWLVAVICVAVAISRLYIGLNWLSDIFGGFCLGGAIISLLIISYRRHKPAELSVPGMMIVVILAFVLGSVWDFRENYGNHLHNYQLYWKTRVVSRDAWWNQTAFEAPLYRTDRFGRPKEVFNLQWAGSLKMIKSTLAAHGWKAMQVRSYTDIVLQLLQQTDFAKRRPLMTQLYDSRPPVLGMLYYYAPHKPPLILRLWRSGIVLSPNKTPLWLGTIGYHVVKHNFAFIHTYKMIPTASGVEYMLELLEQQVWCVKRVTLDTFPPKLRHPPKNLRVLLIKRCV